MEGWHIMRTRHDDKCLWWKDWHSCSCGYLEEEVRDKRTQQCLEIIPNTFAVCGEYYGDQQQFCSDYCLKKSKEEL